MTEATTKLLAVVSEEGGGPWGTDKGLTDPDLLIGVQQERVEELKEKLNQTGREIARMSEFEEEEWDTTPERPKVDADISRSQISYATRSEWVP